MQVLHLCLNLVAQRFWGDQLVWLLAMESCLHSDDQRALNELSRNLSHHNSNIRSWLLKLGWLVRHRLDPDEALPHLLENVASTLGCWEKSLGLGRALCGRDEEFDLRAMDYHPEDFPQQYQERVAHAEKQGYMQYLHPFEIMELKLRRCVGVRSLVLPAS